MDGRISGKRETRSADVTIDKEDRGFLFSVFSHAMVPGRDSGDLPSYEPILRKLYNEIKSGRKTLDDEIGELVNTAVSVTGRMKIQADNVRSPFFAGVMVKDSEAFAITLGKGLAFLYRDDTLFPMTATDIKIEAINTQRQKVDHFLNYCATKTATALCSNIAQLKIDDCLILCNREVYDALGQQEILRILYDAEDQCEAAGNVITEASAKIPGVPLQFMISFVENVSSPEKGGFFGFGRKKNLRQNEEDASFSEEMATGPSMPLGSTPVGEATLSVPVVAEPLFFGNEPTDPLAQPLAEKPVSTNGPEDPMKFQDESMKPFGVSAGKTEPETDEGGFLKPDVEEDDDTTEERSQKTEDTVSEESDDRQSDFTATVNEADEEWKESVDSASADRLVETATESISGREELSDEASPARSKETESSMGYFDFDGKDTPQYIPDDDDEDVSSLIFGDESAEEDEVIEGEYDQAAEYIDYTSQQPISQNDSMFVSSETGRPGGQAGGYYIPFESTDAPEPIQSGEKDIPEMPIYEAPSYNSHSYSGEYSAPSLEGTEIYAKGSYAMDEDLDVRQDYPPISSNHSDDMFSYSVPPKSQLPPSKPPRGGSFDEGTYSEPKQGPRPGARPHPGDPYNQEKGFDYGHTDSSFKRNNMFMIILGGVCVVLVIVIISIFVSQCVKKAEPVDSSSSDISSLTDTSTTESQTTDTSPIDTTTIDPAVTTFSGSEPIGIFVFSDNTGHRTWWDLIHYQYNIQISSETDWRISKIKTYNGLTSDYVPQFGDQIKLPPSSMMQDE
jgi:hypothetical protein